MILNIAVAVFPLESVASHVTRVLPNLPVPRVAELDDEDRVERELDASAAAGNASPLMGRADLPSGTVTFLFTDIEGSTKLLHELGGADYARVLAQHHRIVAEACAAEGGVVVGTEGDAFFVAFSSVPGAVAAAGAAQQGLAGGPVRVRMGLHTGETLLNETGYVGIDVHRAARVAASAHGGQVVLSRETKELAGEGFAFTDLGEHRVKDFSEPVWIYQLGSERFPPLKTLSNTNLPRPASSFVGRERELRELLVTIRSARLVTLTGPGGSGKTRLALEAAATLVPSYKAGVFWIGLASLRDPALVSETIAQTLGAKDGVAEHIGERELLLLLDNLEQVIEAAPQLSALLSACANLNVLVTSRELLRVQGEVEYAVPPLASPDAMALFCERSRLEPSEEIAQLCVRLDELPLAVELAAARATALSPSQILERLSQRLDLFKGGRDADPRQQTLRATIEWSYELLDESERELFARLSVFTGGCTLDAAEEVVAADVDALQSLVDKSLLRFTDERYWMLETIREYAAERLEASGEADRLERQVSNWYRDLSEAYEPELRGPTGARWFTRLEAEIDNIRSAVLWGLANDRLLAFTIVVNTSHFWGETGRTLERARLLDSCWVDDVPVDLKKRALRAMTGAALNANDYETVMSVSKQRLDLARATADDDQEAAAMGMLATGAFLSGDAPTARHWYEAALAAKRKTMSDTTLINTLMNFGLFERNQGNLARSRELLEEGLAISRVHGNELDIAYAVKELGVAAIEAGALGEAKDFLSEGFEIASRLGLGVIAGDLVFAVALLAARTDRPHEGAVLFGAVHAHDERLGWARTPELSWWWALRDELVHALGKSSFEAAFAEGRNVGLDAAVGHARVVMD